MRKNQTILICCFFLILTGIAASDNPEIKSYHTKQVGDTQKPVLDGSLDDPCWNTVEWASDFTQSRPDDGAAPTRQTAFKVLYDDEFVYIGFLCYDENPEAIERRLSRRDGFPGDWVEINFDSYYDKRTAFSFTISASGVKSEEFISGDGNNWDVSWNPIWYAKSRLVDEGWIAEIKIPLSQLRYGNKEEHIWGMQVTRRDFRANERSTWQHIPRTTSGWVSRFGELYGIKDIKPQRQIELQPYLLASAETFEKEEGNPFADGSKTNLDVGLDGKIGVTSDLTLDFTLNPDFGQVEADPSALNLNGFQIFFSERRPFFVENKNLFDFRVTRAEAGGPFHADNLFYSRRIGRSPRGSFDVDDNAFVDYPEFTSILGAAKFSGKTKGGTSIAILESVTSKEEATIDLEGDQSKAIVEPFTNYFVGKISQDLNGGSTVFGVMLNSVNRKLSDTGLDDQFHKSALSGGLDFLHRWKNKEWNLRANFIFSEVKGTESKIYDTQTSFEHYFQRPDADHLSLENKTSLGGHGGTVSLANYGGKDNLSFQGGVTWRSPGLELNDIGFLSTADQIDHFFWMGYRFPNPFSIFRSFRINYNHWLRWDFGGTNLYQATNFNIHSQFTNHFNFSFGTTFEFKEISNKALFGGPALKLSSGFAPWVWIGTDDRKKVRLSLNASAFRGFGDDRDAVKFKNIGTSVRVQPSNAFNFSISPGFTQQDRLIQNVSSDEFMGDTRYITATLKQRTFRTSLRLNYTITPDLTIQFWGQPFISIGNYKDFKFITDPLADNVYDRFHQYEESQIAWDDNESSYLIDEDRDGQVDYSFEDPDFNFLQFRSNMVVRWEYTAGSEVFLVWSQSNTNSGDPDKGIFTSLGDDLFGNKPNNIFLLKWTYRFLN